VFLYASNEQSTEEIVKAIPVTIVAKRIEYRGINLTKKVKDLCTEN